MTKSIEKTAAYLGAAVSLIVLLGSIWKGIFGIATMQYDTKALVSAFNERTVLFTQLASNQENIMEDLEEIRGSRLSVVYVNSDHIIVAMANGDRLKIPMERLGAN